MFREDMGRVCEDGLGRIRFALGFPPQGNPGDPGHFQPWNPRFEATKTCSFEVLKCVVGVWRVEKTTVSVLQTALTFARINGCQLVFVVAYSSHCFLTSRVLLHYYATSMYLIRWHRIRNDTRLVCDYNVRKACDLWHLRICDCIKSIEILYGAGGISRLHREWALDRVRWRGLV